MLSAESIARVLGALNAHNVRYVVIGGIAMRLHGSAHLTDDIDICYGRSPDNLQAIVDTFAHQTPRLRGVPPDVPFLWDTRTLRNGRNFTLTTDLGDFDMLAEPEGVSAFDGIWERSIPMEILGIPVRVASIDDLIAMKRAANRTKDQSHILELEALRKLVREQQQDEPIS